MDRESNIDSIRAVEEQIREHHDEKTIIKLKRARNSFLNISKLPPEVLGNIFHCNVTRNGDFGGLDEGSHNFLLVCHHWFGVALRTPELWHFWGNTPDDWARWCRRSGIAPLDLVLSGDRYSHRYLSDDLWRALNDRATENIVRRVHLKARESNLIDDIINALTADCEEFRSNNMESMVLRNLDIRPVDVSNLFADHRFPKLQHLDFTNCTISSWDYLSSRTSVLTTLKLDFTRPSVALASTPTTPQLLSMLSSNPTLQSVALLSRVTPDDDGGEVSSSRVQLRHLKELRLDGDFRRVLKFLDQLDHPRNMDDLSLTLLGCDAMDIPRTIGPYLRDHLQRRDRSHGGLSLLVSSGIHISRDHQITLRAGDAGGIDFSVPSRAQTNPFVSITATLSRATHKDVLLNAGLDLITYPPREEVVRFRMCHHLAPGLDTYTQFPKLRALSYGSISPLTAFPNPHLVADGEIFPSLEYLSVENMVADSADWSPLVAFLANRVSSGNRLDTLVIAHSSHMCPDVTEGIRGMVRELRIVGERRSSLKRKCCK